eukprot:196992-Pelagomonas_calceolata.AAC.2
MHARTHADGKTVEVNLPVGWLILGGVAYYLYSTMGGAGGQGVGAKHEISFQEFRNQLLAKKNQRGSSTNDEVRRCLGPQGVHGIAGSQGKVQRLEVVNNNRVRVYVRADDSGLSELSQGPLQGGVYKYHFQIGSTDALERKLDEAQRELQVPAERHVIQGGTHEQSAHVMGQVIGWVIAYKEHVSLERTWVWLEGRKKCVVGT